MQYSDEDVAIGHLTDHQGWKRFRIHLESNAKDILEEIERRGFVGDANDIAKLNYRLGQLKSLRDIISIPDEVRKLSSTP